MQYFQKTIGCCLLLFSTLISFSQNLNNTITGKISNSFNKPIENVNAILQNAKDSSIVKASISDAEGRYILENIKPGNYQIVFSAIGFKTIYSDIFLVDTQSIILPNIILQNAAKKLADVVIASNKPPFEFKNGITIINIDALPSSTTSTTLDLLNKMPGISIENANGNNQISIKGKAGVLILVDGKPTYLYKNDLINMLKSLSPSSIDKIEVITNISAKYDAAGSAGVINIKTKKGKQLGFNGNTSTSYTQGVYPRVNSSINFNYRNSKINLFGRYSYNYSAQFERSDDIHNFRNNNNQIIGYESGSNTRYDAEPFHNVILGLDYNIDKNNTIAIKLSGGRGDQTTRVFSFNNIGNSINNITSILQSNSNIKYYEGHLSNTINYIGTLNKQGTQLSINADYAHYVFKTNQFVYTHAYDTSGNMMGNLFSLNIIGNYFTRIYAANADLSHLFKNGIKLETGIKISYINSNNISDNFRLQNITWVKDNINSNHFLYEENIRAAYFIFHKESSKWNTELGLRVENTQMKGTEFITNTIFTRNYINAFPHFSFLYHINSTTDINIGYNGRIERPAYKKLNPFTFFYDSLNRIQGNPYLEPALSYNFELGYTYKKISATLNYSYTYKALEDLYQQDVTQKIFYDTYDNIGSLSTIGISINVPFNVQNWWKVYTNTYLYNVEHKGKDSSQLTSFNKSQTAALFKVNNTFIILPSLIVELSVDYKTERPGIENLLIKRPAYNINFGIVKTVLHNMGSITFTIQAINQHPKGFALYNNVDYSYVLSHDRSRIGLAFNYRFGKKTVAEVRKIKNNIVEEKSRAGG